MKTFITTMIIFCITIVFIIWNSMYITNLANDFCNRLESLDTGDNGLSKKLSDISDKWEHSKRFVQISISHTEIELITDMMSSIQVYAKAGELSDYEQTRQLLLNSFNEMRLLEKLSLINIL